MNDRSSLQSSEDRLEIVNYRALRNWLLLVGRSCSRRKRVVVVTFAILLGVTTLAAIFLPRTYHVETTLLAQRNAVLAVYADRSATDTLMHGAVETVRRRENLLDLIRQTDLLRQRALRRESVLRVKDWLVRLLHGGKTPTEQEQLDGTVGLLEKRLVAWTGDGTVTIAIDWSDDVLAYRLVDAAQHNFLHDRRVQEITTLAESISILEGHSAEMSKQIDGAIQDLQRLREQKARSDRSSNMSASNAASPGRPNEAPRLLAAGARPRIDAATVARRAELRATIEAKQRAVSDLEDFRRRRLAELHAKLAEQRGAYTEAHPIVVDIKHAIESLSQESPQVVQLRRELKALQDDPDQRTRVIEDSSPLAASMAQEGASLRSRTPRLGGDVLRIEQEPAEDRDPEVEYAKSRLRFAINKHQEIREHIQTAHIDFDTAQAAFKYRYTVVVPAELPKGPVKPKVWLMLFAGAIGGLLLGVIGAVMIDLRSGLLFEAWQVQSALCLPVLGEVELMRLPKSEGP